MTNQNNTQDRPLVGISVGDINGIGPEVILKTLQDNRILDICIPVIYASGRLFNKYRKDLNLQEDIHFFQAKSVEAINPKKINVVNCLDEDLQIEPGEVTQLAGKAAYISLNAATEDLKLGKINALVTAPVNKKNMQQEEFNFPGHTEYLAHTFEKEVLMTMVSDEINLRIAVATGHIPIADVKKSLSKNLLENKLKLLIQTLKHDFLITKPKIAVLGLNPHAGENGLLGNEENEVIEPVITEFREKGNLIYGPYPADGFFGNGMFSKFDGILAMYHDQGLIPFKTLAFESGVNFTAGLPVIRTSPDHGTAYDIAGKGKADESSFRHALYLAAKLARKKMQAVAI